MNFLIFWGIFISSHVSLAEPVPPCEISVKYYYKTGAEETRKYNLVAKSEKECSQKSDLYRLNTSPRKVIKKEVSVKWLSK